MQAEGLSVSFQNWSAYGGYYTGRNVIATLSGALRPTEVVIVMAHMDNLPNGSRAPGADDNASGAVAAMTMARLMAGQRFERTLRFLFTTGEEQGFLGSAHYASDAQDRGENIVAVYNLDMLAWDDNDDGFVALETRVVSDPGYPSDLEIANTFIDVVTAYGLSDALHPTIDAISDEAVDSWSFWELGFPSVTAIEDFEHHEVNPYYHTTDDTISTLNMPFYTSFVKASLGTAAHLAIPGEGTSGALFLPYVVSASW